MSSADPPVSRHRSVGWEKPSHRFDRFTEKDLTGRWKKIKGTDSYRHLKDLIEDFDNFSGSEKTKLRNDICQMLQYYSARFRRQDLPAEERGDLIRSVINCLRVRDGTILLRCNYALGHAFSQVQDGGNWGLVLQGVVDGIQESLHDFYSVELRYAQIEALCQVLDFVPQERVRTSEEFVKGLSALIVLIQVRYRRVDPRVSFHVEWALNLIKDIPVETQAETLREVVEQGLRFAKEHGVTLIEGAMDIFEGAMKGKPKDVWKALCQMSAPLKELGDLCKASARDRWYSTFRYDQKAANLETYIAHLDGVYSGLDTIKNWQLHYARIMRLVHLMNFSPGLSDEDLQNAFNRLKAYLRPRIVADKVYVHLLASVAMKLCDNPSGTIRKIAYKELKIHRHFSGQYHYVWLANQVDKRRSLVIGMHHSSLPNPKRSRRSRKLRRSPSPTHLLPPSHLEGFMAQSPTFGAFFKNAYLRYLRRIIFERILLMYQSDLDPEGLSDLGSNSVFDSTETLDEEPPAAAQEAQEDQPPMRRQSSRPRLSESRSFHNLSDAAVASARPLSSVRRQRSFSAGTAQTPMVGSAIDLRTRWELYQHRVIKDVGESLSLSGVRAFALSEWTAVAKKLVGDPAFVDHKERFLTELLTPGIDRRDVAKNHYDASVSEWTEQTKQGQDSMNRAAWAMSSGKYLEAYEEFVHALTFDHTIPFVFYRWAQVCLEMDLPEQAEACLRHEIDTLSLGTGRSTLLLGRAVVMQGAGRLEEGVKLMEKSALELPDQAPEAYCWIAQSYYDHAQGLSSEFLRVFLTEALNCLKKALDTSSDFVFAHRLRAKILFALYLDLPADESIATQLRESIAEFIRVAPQDVESQFLRVQYLYVAITNFSFETHTGRIQHFQLIDEAIECARIVLNLDPEHIQAMEYMGDFYRFKKHFTSSIEWYDRSIQKGNVTLSVYLGMGESLYGQSFHDPSLRERSLTFFGMAVHQYPQNSMARLWKGIANWLDALPVARFEYEKVVEMTESGFQAGTLDSEDYANRFSAMIALTVIARIQRRSEPDADLEIDLTGMFTSIEEMFYEEFPFNTVYFLEKAVANMQIGNYTDAMKALAILDDFKYEISSGLVERNLTQSVDVSDSEACVSLDEYENIDWSTFRLLKEFPWLNIKASFLMHKLRVFLAARQDHTDDSNWDGSSAKNYLEMFEAAVQDTPSAVNCYLLGTSFMQMYGLTGHSALLEKGLVQIIEALKLDPVRIRNVILFLARHQLERHQGAPTEYNTTFHSVSRVGFEEGPNLSIADAYCKALERLVVLQGSAAAEFEDLVSGVRRDIHRFRDGVDLQGSHLPVDPFVRFQVRLSQHLYDTGVETFLLARDGLQLGVKYTVCLSVLYLGGRMAGIQFPNVFTALGRSN